MTCECLTLSLAPFVFGYLDYYVDTLVFRGSFDFELVNKTVGRSLTILALYQSNDLIFLKELFLLRVLVLILVANTVQIP